MSAVEGAAKSWKRALDDAWKIMTKPDFFGIRQIHHQRLSAGSQPLPFNKPSTRGQEYLSSWSWHSSHQFISAGHSISQPCLVPELLSALQPPSDSNLIPSFRKLLFINLAQSYLCICLLSTDLLHSDVDIISHWLYPMAAKFSLPRDRRPPTSAMQTDACHLFRVHAQPRQGHPLPLQVRNRQRPCNFECTHP